ncbi:Heparinase II/III-like protein [Candidatus Pelagibacter sp. HTCC7211]|uniref:heparinase II/III family protein n=1 Tax=Pelagibacter sp. (strain HTCC7211) TaxID=439493 RepID=UPI0001839AE0|nr:heparinase II/III-family protein [Candidatus Pelagibacter sp. HTCC7211]EDZ59681.1 Heparinase II/III-like protein [Candidatus Pelagibacter sp. HTCC7211]
MIVKKFLDSFVQIYFNLKNYINRIYQNSNLYDKKISKTYNNTFNYKPSPHLLSSIVKYQKKKYKIEDFSLESIWTNNINLKDYEKLNNFFWFFSLDLKSSKKAVQSLIVNWINNNNKYNNKSWDFDLTSKRVISWLSNHELTYDDDDKEFKIKFDSSIQKQTNHLLNEIKNSKVFENKMIGCSAIILTGLAYQNNKIYLDNGLSFLRKIIKTSIDNNGFPKSRNIKQLIYYLKYFILIREWFKESQNTIPEFIDETIYYLGINYASIWQNIKHDILFNGNYISNNDEFDQYLKRFNYTFKNENKETAGYAILKNKKIILAMDIGPSPIGPQSNDYQSGALSFEIISSGKKLISNSGYFSNKQNKLNKLSKSTALQNTLIIEDYSSCSFKKLKSLGYLVDQGLKIMNKNIVFEDNYWKISASHDGYLKKFGSIHNREIEFYPEQTKFIGTDKIVRKNKDKDVKFDIRFHLNPDSKVMKTQDNKSILVELENEGWKFSCDKFNINIDNGLYFGNKNSYKENHNIFISGITHETEQVIKWEITRL